MKTFADKLAAACQKLKAKRGMTLEEAAAVLRYSGRQLHNWKQGRIEPKIEDQRYILKTLKAEAEK